MLDIDHRFYEKQDNRYSENIWKDRGEGENSNERYQQVIGIKVKV
jgi:hypothetical protein